MRHGKGARGGRQCSLYTSALQGCVVANCFFFYHSQNIVYIGA